MSTFSFGMTADAPSVSFQKELEEISPAMARWAGLPGGDGSAGSAVEREVEERDRSVMRQEWAARRRAMARPMPREPPVMSACFPERVVERERVWWGIRGDMWRRREGRRGGIWGCYYRSIHPRIWRIYIFQLLE
jgi:hypothetical protein